jgi:murein DD-endopeptidase / murein LD-carboxypeptidase
MKLFLKSNWKFIVIVLASSQVLNTSCSRKLYPEQSFQNIKTETEHKQLEKFMDGGTERIITPNKTSADEIIKTARKYLGVPHCMGGTTTKCMDCSGLLVRVFAGHGIHMPHNSEEQARYGKIVTGMDELVKGDLVFFIKTYKTNRFITHSGIYTGENMFIHTSSSSGVTITSLSDPWWKEKFVFGTRVF